MLRNESSLPYCKSGNDYYPHPKGGKWIDTGVLHEGYDPENDPDDAHVWIFCYQHEGYKDSFMWQPPCRPLPFALPSSAPNNNTTPQQSQPQQQDGNRNITQQQQTVKVLLWGDSLTNQIYASTKRKMTSSIEYKFVKHREPYIIPSVSPFLSATSPECEKAVNANPMGFYLENFGIRVLGCHFSKHDL